MLQVLHQQFLLLQALGCNQQTVLSGFSTKSCWSAEWLIKCSFMSLKFFHHLSGRMSDWADQLPHHKAPAANFGRLGCVTNCCSNYTQ